MASFTPDESLPALHIVAHDLLASTGAGTAPAGGLARPNELRLVTGADEEASVIYDTGYPIGSPKHPEYHSIHADLWDLRERG